VIVTKRPGPYLAIASALALLAAAGSLPAGRVGAADAPGIVISEVHSAGSSASYAADWFELTNTGTTTVDITGWKFDDNSNSPDVAVALRGVTSLAPGASAIFLEGRPDATTDATIIANFSTAWFGSATPPAGTLIGTYGGSGVGMSGSGDAVNLFNAAGIRVTGVSFGAAAAGTPLATFDNSAGLTGATLPLPVVTTVSTDKVNGAFVSFNGLEVGSPGARIVASPLTNIDLSTYVRVGRFDLPEPTRTVPPAGNLLAQEASAVTYNWDTDTLFIIADGSTSIVQVTKTGQLIDTMTLPPGGSPQGTEFYDPEGIAYIGHGQFVFVEERDRQAVLFTYAPGTTLTRAAAVTVKLGTTIGNEGLEGITYDPSTNGNPATDPNTKGFIAVKEINPQGLFQTGINFAAGTATNGSASTVNSINLFDPALLGLTDIADIYALSNLPGLTGSQKNNLLVLSQEEGVIVNVDRSGAIASTLTITDPGNPQPVADMGHEGVAMDGNGVLYIVSENGGGDVNHPQLWVYAPSLVPNQPPTDLTLTNQVATLPENSNTAARIRVANVSVTDDGLGTNVLGVAGADASAFEVDASGLYVKAGTVLDFETKTIYNVTVTVDDVSVGTTPDASANYTLTLTDIVNEEPPASSSIFITEVTPWASGNAPYAADWFELTNKGTTAVNIAGWQIDDDSNGSGLIALSGITEIAPGESVIFIESTNLATTKAAFLTAWFGANAPAGLQIGSYTGSGIGLSTGGDSVNLFDAGGNRVTGIAVPASTTGVTFDNAAGAGSTVLPLPTVSTLTVVGVNGAFVAADGAETGSPGRIAGAVVLPSVVISEVTPWGSGNSPYGSDWFEVTNIGPGPVDVTGWKMDDDSGLFGSAVALTGVSVIAPGESVIFMETSNLTAAKSEFLIAWFGGAANAPAGLQIGSYSGTGVGLGTGGDEVSLFDAAGHRITGVSVGASTVGATFDNAAGLGGTEKPLPAVATLSVAGVNGAFQAADGHGRGSPGRIVTPDTTAPVLTAPAAISSTTTDSTGVVITFVVTALDEVDGVTAVTCVPASGTKFAVGVTTVTCSSTDAAGNTGTATFNVTVTFTPPATPDGRIYGFGHVDDGGKHHHFAFRVSEVGNRDYGRFEYWVKDKKSEDRDDDNYDRHRERNGNDDRDYGRDRKKPVSRFEATSIASVEFSDDPRSKPGRFGLFSFLFRPPTVDSVKFSGTGKWNGKAGYTFVVTASDKGEPGRRRDTFTLVIKDATGKVVASVDDVIDGGNIQSTRLLFGWF
jgi:uncharacterized protein YjiK